MKERHLLQKIYDDAIENKHWVFFDWFPLYKHSVQEYKVQAVNNNWTDTVFQKLVKDTTENGISDLRQGNFTWEEFEKIKNNWSAIQPVIKIIAKENKISKAQYQKIIAFFRKQTSGNRPSGTNRVVAAFLPNIVTTVINYRYLKDVITKLKDRLSDYPEIQEEWLTDNFNFINYCSSNIEFNDPWHSSVFAWYLKEYFEQERELTRKNEASMQKYIDLLLNNKNLILTGAPGTGKTYLAKQIAAQLGEWEFVQFHPSYDYTDFVEGLRPLKKDGGELGFELRDGIFKTFCKKALQNLIDSSKSEDELKKEDIVRKNISDFLDKCIDDGDELELSTGNKFTISEYNDTQIKVKVPNNAITSELALPFHELSQLLLKEQSLDKVKDIREFFNRSHNRQSDSYIYTLYNNQELSGDLENSNAIEKIERKNFVIIIDEINRAEISKVFGELFFSIDSGYRGEKGKVKTQYSNLQDEADVFFDGFYVPENVYIIGTMNDIDRSVESMDFAMRRRFAWKEITALERTSMWNEQIDEWKGESEQRMISLNYAIENIQGLNSSYHIGPAYFLKLGTYKKVEAPFEHLWQNHLKGVIFEYLRGLPNSTEIMENLKLSYDMKADVENI
ncbi:MAG: AAA family ATPase [Marinifilaceae bacterium]